MQNDIKKDQKKLYDKIKSNIGTSEIKVVFNKVARKMMKLIIWKSKKTTLQASQAVKERTFIMCVLKLRPTNASIEEYGRPWI